MGVVGCTARVISVADTDEESSSSASSTTDDPRDESEDDGTDGGGSPILDIGSVEPAQRFASILFVIDDTVSMGVSQLMLSGSIDALLDPLEAAGVDYRLAFTTTDNGNLWCGNDFISAPEGGNFVSSSCKTRLYDFVSVQANEHDICLQRCPLDELFFEPTTTEVDPTPRYRPWVERIGGVTNLAPETDLRLALGCIMPQGVAGCGFEQPLESMYKAILRTQRSDEDEYGFFNPAGLAVVVIVTDEIDCSYDTAWEEIFDPDGSRRFWPNTMEPVPTSALCWNAGVRCEGNPAALFCAPENYDVHRNSGVSDDEAVMRPVSRYTALLAGLGNVYVAGILGVPPGYASGDEEIRYTDEADPQFLHDFGIAPGCENGQIRAVPPVRTRLMIEETNGAESRDMFSICDLDYGAHLKTIADRILVRLPP